MVDLSKYGHKVADTFDEAYHKGLKGAIRRDPLTYFFAAIGGAALLGFVAGLFV